MYYRRKVVLALLQQFGGTLPKISLQKLLLLFTQRQQQAVYDFIPYQFGSYSYSLSADLYAMSQKNFIKDEENSVVNIDTKNYFDTLTEQDKNILRGIYREFSGWDNQQLMYYTYTHLPYYAINSTAKNILSKEELQLVEESRNTDTSTVLFTIGYEGVSLETYLNKLIKNNIKALIDVRRNPLSMKFGFSKNQLVKYCENLGIKYIHIPEVGIASEQRQTLNTQEDYDKLFEVYKQETLTATQKEQAIILSLLEKYNRIALTCFEADICQCHRTPLANSIANLEGFKYTVKHI